MTSIGSGSGQPHLLALLRAARLRQEPPETAPQEAADADGATASGSSGPDDPSAQAPGSSASVRPVLPSSLRGAAVHTPAGTAVVVSPGSGVVVPAAVVRPAAVPPAVVPPAVVPAVVVPQAPPAIPATPATAMPALPAGPVPPVTVTGPVGPVVPPAGWPSPDGRPAPGPPGTPPTGILPPGTLPPGTLPPGPSRPGGLLPIGGAPPLRGGDPASPGAPVDGPDPADDVALHDLHRLLSTSLSLAGEVDAVAGRLRDALVLAQPRLIAVLPGTEAVQREQLAQALTWLVDNLEHPPALAAGCAQLGAALREFGVGAPQLQLIGAALAEAMRAGMANGWRQEYDTAWRSTWQHVHQWIAHGAAEAAYQPMRWTAVVTEHDQRCSDLAVLRVRPYLPMPFRAGQYAHVEVAELPGVWRPYSLAGAPRVDNVLELHVRAKSEAGVSGALVHRTRSGDRVRLSRVAGEMVLPPVPGRDLLLIAGDTGVAPLKAMLTDMAITADPRSAVLFWGVRTLDDLYDIDEVAAIARACQRATVVPVISEGEPGAYASGLVTDAVTAYGEWSGHEVYLAGPPPMLAATRAVLRGLGLADDRIHHDPTGVDRPTGADRR